MHERRDNDSNRWKFSRTLSLDSLLAIAAATLAVLFFGTTLDKRLTVAENKYEELRQAIDRNEANQKERANRIEDTVREQGRIVQQLLSAPRTR